MPELPEVEIIKIFLAENIVGLSVRSIEVLNPKSFIGDFNLIVGKEIQSIERRAKVLRIGFGEFEILIHLKMSGQIILKRQSGIEEKRQSDFIGGHPTLDMFGELPNERSSNVATPHYRSTRVIFNLSDGSTLFFNDQRKFGWIKLVDRLQVVGDRFLDKLGPEPLEEGFSWEILKNNLLRRKGTPTKVAILDQEVVAGVGNIYACEACFLAGIDPGKKSGELNDSEFKKLHKAIIEALQSGIKYGGSSKTHFANPEGKKGVFLDFAFVYGREKLPCKNCKTPIKKIKLGGRGTFYCPKCQVVE